MKDRLLAVVALLLAAGALGHSLWLKGHSEKAAEEALRTREKELVQAATPHFERAYVDMLGDFKRWEKKPETAEELFRPMIAIVKKMQGVPGEEAAEPS